MDLGSVKLYLGPEISVDLLDRIQSYVDGIYTGAGKLTQRYKELPPGEREGIEKGVLSISGYLIPLLVGHPELGPIIDPLVQQIYTFIKTGYGEGEMRQAAGEVGDAMKYLKRYLMTTKQNEKSESQQESSPTVSTALASIIGLSILGLGFSLRLGTEITGKVGSVTSTSLPFLLIFLIILLFSGFYAIKNKRIN